MTTACMLVLVWIHLIILSRKRHRKQMSEVGDFVYGLPTDGSHTGKAVGHVLHVHVWRTIRNCTVQAIETADFVSWP